MKNLKASKNTI